MNFNRYKNDCEFGLGCEDNLKNFFNEEYGIEIKKRELKYAVIDFYNEEYEIELKSRSNRFYWGQFDDWSIGYNKFKEGYKQIIENNKKVYFIFNLYTDYKKTKRDYYVYELTKERFEIGDTYFLKEGGNFYRNDKKHLLGQIKKEFIIPIDLCGYFN